jgi:MFS family permease
MQLSRHESSKYNIDDDFQEYGYLKLIFNKKFFQSKIEQNQNEEFPVYEPLMSLVVSYPFVQLNCVFFFACLYSVIDLSSLRRLGLLFGLNEDFLWKTSLAWKILNAVFFSLWGYYLDKLGIKTILMTALIGEIINNSMCYFLVQFKLGYIISMGLSAAINSGYLALTPTCYALIFGDEKGILLYSISSILINTFYICRPVLNNIVVDKVYFLMLFMIMTIFSMFALIILCFFEEKKHIFKEEIKYQKKESFFKRASELSDMDTGGEENSEGNNSLLRGFDNAPK